MNIPLVTPTFHNNLTNNTFQFINNNQHFLNHLNQHHPNRIKISNNPTIHSSIIIPKHITNMSQLKEFVSNSLLTIIKANLAFNKSATIHLNHISISTVTDNINKTKSPAHQANFHLQLIRHQ